MRRAKYLLVSAFDVASVVVIVGGAWLALAEPAAAYVDPSVMTYTIQALAGVAVALSAVLGVVWRRARRWLLRALRIDENAGKVVEGDVSLISGDDAQRRGQLSKADDAARDERSRQGVEQPQRLPWGARFVLALLASVTLCFMTIVSAPLEIVASNASNLSFSPANVWLPLAATAVLASLVLAFAISAARGRAFDVLRAGLRVSLQPTDIALMYYQLGYVMWKRGSADAGVACYLKAVEASPSIAMQATAELRELVAETGASIPPAGGVEAALAAEGIPCAPASETLDVIDAALSAACDAGLANVARSLLATRLRHRPDDALMGVLRSFGEPA